jgi:hypothetical protein
LTRRAAASLIAHRLGQVTIAYDKNPSTGQDRFFGVVSSRNARCNRGARVDLGFRPAFEAGGGSSFPRTIVASTQSDTQGNWEVFYAVGPNGTSPFSSYSASSPKRTLKTKKKNVLLVCKIATSQVITLATGGP